MSKTHRTLTRLYLQTIPGGTTGNSTTFAGGNYTTLLPWLQSAMGAYTGTAGPFGLEAQLNKMTFSNSTFFRRLLAGNNGVSYSVYFAYLDTTNHMYWNHTPLQFPPQAPYDITSSLLLASDNLTTYYGAYPTSQPGLNFLLSPSNSVGAITAAFDIYVYVIANIVYYDTSSASYLTKSVLATRWVVNSQLDPTIPFPDQVIAINLPQWLMEPFWVQLIYGLGCTGVNVGNVANQLSGWSGTPDLNGTPQATLASYVNPKMRPFMYPTYDSLQGSPSETFQYFMEQTKQSWIGGQGGQHLFYYGLLQPSSSNPTITEIVPVQPDSATMPVLNANPSMQFDFHFVDPDGLYYFALTASFDVTIDISLFTGGNILN